MWAVTHLLFVPNTDLIPKPKFNRAVRCLVPKFSPEMQDELRLEKKLRPDSMRVFVTAGRTLGNLAGGLLRLKRYERGLVRRGVNLDFESAGEGLDAVRVRRSVEAAIDHRRKGGRAVVQATIPRHQSLFQYWRARLAGVPVVVNVGIAPEGAKPLSGWHRQRRWWAHWLLFKAFSRTIFLTEELRRLYAAELGAVGKGVRTIPNGVDLKRFRPAEDTAERDRLRQQFGLSGAGPVAVFVGGVMRRKGLDVVLKGWNDVLQRHPEARLVVVGSMEGRTSHQHNPGLASDLAAYCAEVRALRGGCFRPESVLLAGEADDPAPFYRAADVFVFPSRLEGLPNALLEAMASGLPCVTGRFAGIPRDGEELGKQGSEFLVLGHDPAEWTRCLNELLADEGFARRRELGGAARRWVESHHDLERILDAWAALYNGRDAGRRAD
jgi:glycosyltransferase involved in cell wall biosynthesis